MRSIEKLTALLDDLEQDESLAMRAIAAQVKEFFSERVQRHPLEADAQAEAITQRLRMSLELAIMAQAEAAGVHPFTEH